MRVSWPSLAKEVAECKRCRLHETRTNTVLGEGDIHSPVMFVGEGPGAQEDMQGRPFVGRAGQLLDRMLAAIGWTRDSVYITNIIKCRPPDNRTPEPDETSACLPHLRAQVAMIEPLIIVALGSAAARRMLGPDIKITRDRGNLIEIKGVFFLPTYHPAALLRDSQKKHAAWEDMQLLRDTLTELGYPPPSGNG